MDEQQYGEHLNTLIAALLNKVKAYNPHAQLTHIEKALVFAAKIHEGKTRASGDAHFIHSFNIGLILADLKLDSHTICAGILHDALEAGMRPDTIAKEFDEETLMLIKSVTKLAQVKSNLSLEEERERRAENLRKILLATAKDIRVIMIKLADRLHNVQTLKYLPEDKRKIIAQETMDIYAPIAHKLGMYHMKAELEDWAFRFIHPATYQEIKDKVASKRNQREQEVRRIVEFVRTELSKKGIDAEIHGRAKHFYSIYKKLLEKDRNFDEIYDLIAIRIITNSVDDCYSALGVIHALWKPMPSRLKDYIAVPKPNGYQSIHTGVFIAPGKVLEVQIRDRMMHRVAEEGIASHWRYKGDEKDKKFDRYIEWLKQILEWKRTDDAKEFIESLKIDLFAKEIFVFTPKGDPISLPEEGTPIDFAYAVHTDVGNHCKQAKVNGSIVPLDHKLSPGDIVEIITVKEITASRAWLTFVKSIHTKIKIKHVLNMAAEPVKRKRDREQAPEPSGFEDSIVHQGKKYDLKIPGCCAPRVTDKIRAFKTKDGKIVVHKSDCINVHNNDLSKELLLEVPKEELSGIPLRIDVHDKIGVLADILSYVSKQGQHVRAVNTRLGKDGRILVRIDVEKSSLLDVDALIKGIRSREAVINVFVDKE